jgi:hypothetical protein
MADRRLDVEAAVDRLMFIPGKGHLIGMDSRPGQSSNATTGVPVDGIAGFAHGAIFFNMKGTAGAQALGSGTGLYVNQGTNLAAVWANIG